jgi:ATP-dependent RNA helicase DeaD
LKIVEPTEIQQKQFRYKYSLVGLAKTGTGKTAFGCLFQLIDTTSPAVQALVLVPTESWASDFLKPRRFCKYLPEVSIAGGIPIKPQIALGCTTHIVVATPGRLIDLIQRKAINKRRN